jgi:exopolysaccharide biosynthesis polyprenyl glycosylphosphotransferase
VSRGFRASSSPHRSRGNRLATLREVAPHRSLQDEVDSGATPPAWARSKRAAEVRPRWWGDMLRRRILAGADLVAASISIALLTGDLTGFAWAILSLPLWILGAKVFGLYDRDHQALRHSTIDELGPLAGWMTMMVIFLAWAVLPITPAATPSEGAIALAWVGGLGSAIAARSFGRWAWRRTVPPERCLVVGDRRLVRAIERKVELFPDLHLDLSSHPGGVAELEHAPEGLLQTVDRLVIASDTVEPAVVEGLVVACRQRQVKLSVVSPLRGGARPARRLGQIADLPMLEFDTSDPSRSTLMLKRAMDLSLASLAALVTLPLVPLIVIAVRLEGSGPILFMQRRAGLNGEPFEMYKFRTMAVDAPNRRQEVVDLDRLREPAYKLSSDPRVTAVGRVLRRSSLDELPQLLNVLKGDMSLVGPRPEEVELVERYAPEHRFRLSVKPGLTGPMQVYGRGELHFEERLEVELDYVENLSLLTDLRILAATIPAVFRGSGAW